MHLVTRLSIGNLFVRLHLTVERAFIIRSYRMLNAGTEHAVFNGKAAGLLIAAGRTPVKDIADNNTFILLAGNLTGIDDDITYTISAELQEEIILDLDIALIERKVAVSRLEIPSSIMISFYVSNGLFSRLSYGKSDFIGIAAKTRRVHSFDFRGQNVYNARRLDSYAIGERMGAARDFSKEDRGLLLAVLDIRPTAAEILPTAHSIQRLEARALPVFDENILVVVLRL